MTQKTCHLAQFTQFIKEITFILAYIHCMKLPAWFRQWFLLLTGGILGAWFFSLPYTMHAAGPIPAISIILGVGMLVMVLHLILAEVALSLPGENTFVWLARSLFPHRLAQATAAITMINFFIGMIAYGVLGWGFLQTLLQYIGIHIDTIWTVTVYTGVISYATRYWLKKSHIREEKIVIISLIVIGIIIMWWWLQGQDISTIPSVWQKWFWLYGLALFSMSGIGTIPLLYNSIGKKAHTMRQVIMASWVTVTMICLFFGLAIISLSGEHISSDSIRWLAMVGGSFLGVVGSLLGVTAITSCHIPMGIHLKEILHRDQKLSGLLSWATITMLPFLVYLYFDPNIIQVLSIAGWILGWLLTIIVAMMNIRLHSTAQKVKIISMIDHDKIRSRVLIVICGVGVLYNIFAL